MHYLFLFLDAHVPHGEIGNLYDFLYQLKHLKVDLENCFKFVFIHSNLYLVNLEAVAFVLKLEVGWLWIFSGKYTQLPFRAPTLFKQ